MRTSLQERRYYNRWGTYEKDLSNDGWQVPYLLVKHVRSFLGHGQTVLDIGCGTGLVGVELMKAGWYGQLVGIDIAERRLREAIKKSIYSSCFCMNADKLGFESGVFDAVLSSAVVGLTGKNSVREMCRVVKNGGVVAFAAGELKSQAGSRKRYKIAVNYITKLSNMEQIYSVDLGTGYCGGRTDEHYVLYIFRRR